MFRKMRRQGQELSKEECEEILTNQPRGVLALLGDYDYPYAIPMSHVFVNGKIYFHCAKKGHKRDAVTNHSKCSFCVLDDGVKAIDSWWYTFKSVIAFGNIRILADRDEKIDALTHLGDKFFPSHDDVVDEIDRLLDRTEVYEISIEHMSGKIVQEK